MHHEPRSQYLLFRRLLILSPLTPPPQITSQTSCLPSINNAKCIFSFEAGCWWQLPHCYNSTDSIGILLESRNPYPFISLGPRSSFSNDFTKGDLVFKQHQFSRFSIFFHSSALLSSHLLFHDEHFDYWCALVAFFLTHKAPQKKSSSKIFYKKTSVSVMLKKLHDYSKPTPKWVCLVFTCLH